MALNYNGLFSTKVRKFFRKLQMNLAVEPLRQVYFKSQN
jgi:hypothetical protein